MANEHFTRTSDNAVQAHDGMFWTTDRYTLVGQEDDTAMLYDLFGDKFVVKHVLNVLCDVCGDSVIYCPVKRRAGLVK